HGNCGSCHNPKAGYGPAHESPMVKGLAETGPSFRNATNTKADDQGIYENAYQSTVDKGAPFWLVRVDAANDNKRERGHSPAVAKAVFRALKECLRSKDTVRIKAGDPSCSEIFQRISSRSPYSWASMVADGQIWATVREDNDEELEAAEAQLKK